MKERKNCKNKNEIIGRIIIKKRNFNEFKTKKELSINERDDGEIEKKEQIEKTWKWKYITTLIENAEEKKLINSEKMVEIYKRQWHKKA